MKKSNPAALYGLQEKFGSHLGIKLTPKSVGWAVLEYGLIDPRSEAIDGRDPIEVAVGVWVANDRPPVRLIVYQSDDQFKRSAHASTMSREEHRAMALRLKKRIEKLGGRADLDEVL